MDPSGVRRLLLPRTVYSFDSVRVGQSQTFTVADYVEISTLREVSVIVRYHAGAFTFADANVVVKVSGDGWYLFDFAIFLVTSTLFATATMNVSGGRAGGEVMAAS